LPGRNQTVWRLALTTIHPTAIVDPKAELGEGVEIGPYSIVESDVIIGNNCKIQSHVFIDSGTRLGEGIKISKGAVLGTAPQDLKYKGEKTYLEVGDGTNIREFATLNRGTDHSYKTVVGKNCFLMAYSHIAHDCIIRNNVIIANAVNMAGHVEIDDFAGIGGLSAIHQFVKIGQYCFVGGGLRVQKDVPPYVLAMGEPMQYGGVNHVGLSRRGFSPEVLLEIKRAYKIYYFRNLTKKDAMEQIRKELKPLPEIEVILQFLERSERGIIKG
jgi:UDP-N-acetylglucosamine acyltransferase